jgi:hypothetical protein
MQRIALFFAITTAVLATGCSKSNDAAPSPQAAATPHPVPPPDAAVREFLEAIRTGDDKKAESMLTDLARTRTAQADLMVAPPGSATARFEIAEMEVIEDQVAHVGCVWTDVGDNGKPQTNEFVWALRRQPQGWRIAGVAVQIFPDQPPLLLDFEDPEDMQRKQQMADAEMQRRMNQASPAAGVGAAASGQVQTAGGSSTSIPNATPVATGVSTVGAQPISQAPGSFGNSTAGTIAPGAPANGQPAMPGSFSPYAPSPLPGTPPSGQTPLITEQPGALPR